MTVIVTVMLILVLILTVTVILIMILTVTLINTFSAGCCNTRHFEDKMLHNMQP